MGSSQSAIDDPDKNKRHHTDFQKIGDVDDCSVEHVYAFHWGLPAYVKPLFANQTNTKAISPMEIVFVKLILISPIFPTLDKIP